MYQTLYRKYRSSNFSELIGQDHVVQTLTNAIQQKRLSHAYIFSGPRGTGKTSTARIIAKLVNQTTEHLDDCPICKRISEGTSVDVIEIDAASNTGVDHMRQLTDQTQFLPVESSIKVFIIDEVHMLSTGAFNALLKTLEEPPPNILFMLATTELHKIPATIQSRAQTLHFKLIDANQLSLHLQDICNKEEMTIEPAALKKLIQQSHGGMRDALSLLDQCMNVSQNNQISVSDISLILGTVNDDDLIEFLTCCFKKDQAAIHQIQNMMNAGVHINQFYDDIIILLNESLLGNDTRINQDKLLIAEWLLWFCEQLKSLKQVNNPGIVAVVQLFHRINYVTPQKNNQVQSPQSSSQKNKKPASSDPANNLNQSGAVLNQSNTVSNQITNQSAGISNNLNDVNAENQSISSETSNMASHNGASNRKVSKEELRQLVKKPVVNASAVSSTMNDNAKSSTPYSSERRPENSPNDMHSSMNENKSPNASSYSVRDAWSIVQQRASQEFKPLFPVIKGASVIEKNKGLYLILDQMYDFFSQKLSESKYQKWFLSQFKSLTDQSFDSWNVTTNLDDVHQLLDHSKTPSQELNEIGDVSLVSSSDSSASIESGSSNSLTVDETNKTSVKSKTVNQIVEMFDGHVLD